MDRLGNYELTEHLASGGMADIWLADQLGPLGFRKRVVVKRIKSDHTGDPDYETMFLDEARLSAQLSHPNIVQTLELGHDGDEWFVAMEWVDGTTLEELIEERRRVQQVLEPSIAIRMALDLLMALAYAHDFIDTAGNHLEIVHRDVTPSNVLISRAGVAKLADFGIAKAVGRETKTQTGAVKGKYGYMAPEQVRGEAVDPRTDIFAAGIVLYESLCGVRPFGKGLEAVHGVLEREPLPLTEHQPELPAGVRAVVERALQKDVGERWQSAAQMCAALENAAKEANLLATVTSVSALVENVATGEHDLLADPLAQTATSTAVPPEAQSHAWLPVIAVAGAVSMLFAGAGLVLMSPGGATEPAAFAAPVDSPDGGADSGSELGREVNVKERQRERIRKLSGGSRQEPEESEERAEDRKRGKRDLDREQRKRIEKREKWLEKKRASEAKKRNKGGRGRGKGRRPDDD